MIDYALHDELVNVVDCSKRLVANQCGRLDRVTKWWGQKNAKMAKWVAATRVDSFGQKSEATNNMIKTPSGHLSLNIQHFASLSRLYYFPNGALADLFTPSVEHYPCS